MKVEQTECSETSAYKIQTPGNYPEESIKKDDRKFEFRNTNNCKEILSGKAYWNCCVLRINYVNIHVA